MVENEIGLLDRQVTIAKGLRAGPILNSFRFLLGCEGNGEVAFWCINNLLV